MEAGSAIALAIVLLAGGGSAGAIMMTDGVEWAHHGMMGYGGGMMGGGDVQDCPYEDGDADQCFRGADGGAEDCQELSDGDCPYYDEADCDGGGCGGGGCWD